MHNKICENCGKNFEAKKTTLKYCSRECYEEKRARKENKCKACWKSFIWNRNTQQYCSQECYMKDISLEIIHKKCPTCWKEFDTKDVNRIYCCIECRNHQEKKCEICWEIFISNSYNQKACNNCTKELGERQRKSLRVYVCKYCWNEFEWGYWRTTCEECIKKLSSVRAIEMNKHYAQLPEWDKQKRKDKIRTTIKQTLNNIDKNKRDERQQKKSNSLKQYYASMTEEEYEAYRSNLIKKAEERYKKTWYMRPVQQPEVVAAISSISKKEKKRETIFVDMGLNVETQFSIGAYRYDLKIWNTLIEINPFPFHNSTFAPKKKNTQPKHRLYHYNKTKYAIDNWYNIINVRDWMGFDDVISLLNKKTFIEDAPTLHRYNPKTKEHLIDEWFSMEEMLDKGFVEIRDWWEFYLVTENENG